MSNQYTAPPMPERFWQKVEKGSDCWEWRGARNALGYGLFRGKRAAAHVTAYELTRGPVPAGMDLDHLCRNRGCVNPDHLEPGTHLENVRRGSGHGSETHCRKGHPYSGENLVVRANGDRRCRTCDRASRKRYVRALLSGAPRPDKPFDFGRESRRFLVDTYGEATVMDFEYAIWKALDRAALEGSGAPRPENALLDALAPVDPGEDVVEASSLPTFDDMVEALRLVSQDDPGLLALADQENTDANLRAAASAILEAMAEGWRE